MIHEYDDIDMVIVWETVKKDIPALIPAIEKILI
ncbi:HepT-like ribonuclease domain-containing protein [Thermodesulfobacteriota bacterium]